MLGQRGDSAREWIGTLSRDAGILCRAVVGVVIAVVATRRGKEGKELKELADTTQDALHMETMGIFVEE